MKIKTSELTGIALDWAVAMCEGGEHLAFDGITWGFVLNRELKVLAKGWAPSMSYLPSTDWAQGGPIIERLILRAGLVLRCYVEQQRCEASLDFPHKFSYGPTPLVAALRCYVASRLGDEVEVPDALCGGAA